MWNLADISQYEFWKILARKHYFLMTSGIHYWAPYNTKECWRNNPFIIKIQYLFGPSLTTVKSMGEDLDTSYAQINGDINSPWYFRFHCQIFLRFSEKLSRSHFTASSRLPQQICHTRNEWWVSVDCFNN